MSCYDLLTRDEVAKLIDVYPARITAMLTPPRESESESAKLRLELQNKVVVIAGRRFWPKKWAIRWAKRWLKYVADNRSRQRSKERAASREREAA